MHAWKRNISFIEIIKTVSDFRSIFSETVCRAFRIHKAYPRRRKCRTFQERRVIIIRNADEFYHILSFELTKSSYQNLAIDHVPAFNLPGFETHSNRSNKYTGL